jgi:hypothetical protein
MQVGNPHWQIIALILWHIRMDHALTQTAHAHLTECLEKSEAAVLGWHTPSTTSLTARMKIKICIGSVF